MPSLAVYRSLLAVECGPYVGPESYEVRATSGSDVTKLMCSQYPVRSGIPQNDLYTERPLYRPDADTARRQRSLRDELRPADGHAHA